MGDQVDRILFSGFDVFAEQILFCPALQNPVSQNLPIVPVAQISVIQESAVMFRLVHLSAHRGVISCQLRQERTDAVIPAQEFILLLSF
ncbi:predicted protein [Streptomyces iranensis]|uniref:Uncharacterized protein n=1 Tax=Streptomyces iranensis TaxID=576784 RepID=A0A061A677_9ACTN|nr:predicted protein [Streptomyces iranensis]